MGRFRCCAFASLRAMPESLAAWAGREETGMVTVLHVLTVGLIRRPWSVFYLKNKISGVQTSLKTNDKHEAQRILQAHNESECQPHFNLSLARVYLNATDPKLATRTWQEVMEHIVAKKMDETRRRWDTAIKDKNFDCIRRLRVAETAVAV